MTELERTITSNEVAEMVQRDHKEVLRDIRNIIKQLGESKIALSYFIESTYINSQNKELPNFLLSKKGCELYSTRMTGEKGTQFAVAYIERFNDMEVHIKRELDTTSLSPELQMFNGLFQSLANQELATKQLETKVDGITEIVGVSSTNWREDSNKLVNKIVRVHGGSPDSHREVRAMIFEEVDKRGGVSLQTRLTNKRRRMADEGVSKSRRDRLTKIDVIADDKKLIEIYVAVVKEYAIKYGVWK